MLYKTAILFKKYFNLRNLYFAKYKLNSSRALQSVRSSALSLANGLIIPERLHHISFLVRQDDDFL